MLFAIIILSIVLAIETIVIVKLARKIKNTKENLINDSKEDLKRVATIIRRLESRFYTYK